MTFRTLLMLIFAPVLGLFVRVRAFAVVAALVCAVGLPVGGSALAQSGEEAPEWRVECMTDEWDDTPHCHTYAGSAKGHLDIVHHCSTVNGEAVEHVYFSRPADYWYGGTDLSGLATAPAQSENGDRLTLHKVQIRWDKESASEVILSRGKGRGEMNWLTHKFPSDSPFWEKLEMTPVASFLNPIRLLQEKSQLRVRGKSDGSPTVFTFSLAGAREAIAEARRRCGL